jgi:hypothetical protein
MVASPPRFKSQVSTNFYLWMIRQFNIRSAPVERPSIRIEPQDMKKAVHLTFENSSGYLVISARRTPRFQLNPR